MNHFPSLWSTPVTALINHVKRLERIGNWIFYAVIIALFAWAVMWAGDLKTASAVVGLFAALGGVWFGLGFYIDGCEVHTKIRNHRALGATPGTITAMMFRYGAVTALTTAAVITALLAVGYRTVQEIFTTGTAAPDPNSDVIWSFKFPGGEGWQHFLTHIPWAPHNVTTLTVIVVFFVLIAMAAYPAGAAQSMVFHSLAGAPPMVRPLVTTITWIGLFALTAFGLFPVTTWLCYKAAQHYRQDMGFKHAG